MLCTSHYSCLYFEGMASHRAQTVQTRRAKDNYMFVVDATHVLLLMAACINSYSYSVDASFLHSNLTSLQSADANVRAQVRQWSHKHPQNNLGFVTLGCWIDLCAQLSFTHTADNVLAICLHTSTSKVRGGTSLRQREHAHNHIPADDVLAICGSSPLSGGLTASVSSSTLSKGGRVAFLANSAS